MESEDMEFTPERVAAAQLLIARLRCELDGRDFKPSDLGYDLVPAADPIMMMGRDSGFAIRRSDVAFAATVMLYSSLILWGQSTEASIDELLQGLAVRVAAIDRHGAPGA